MKRAVTVMACFWCAVGFALLASRAGHRADAVWQNATIYLEQKISAEDAQRFAITKEGVSFTAWTQKADRTIEVPDLGKQVQTSVYELCGSSEYVLPEAPVLSADDPNGCLVAKDTAWNLYGSTDIIGQRVVVNNKSYIVRGIVNSPATGIYIQLFGSTSHKAEFDHLTIEKKDPQDAAKFLMQYGLAGHVLRMDYFKNMNTLLELVPGKWSDFPGWKAAIAMRKTRLRQIEKMRKTGIEYYYKKQCMIYWSSRMLELLSVTTMVLILCGKKGGFCR